MPIAALSENAARAICSSLVLNDAISVIKELIDNALDSHATNIIIEIAANTLDIIQVKDNGTGIGIEDRQLLCKRGYTSKIRTFQDLEQLGGTFLGFRGEALASVAELSESVAFTTRVDGETVGTQLKFDSKGKLSSSSSAAHGTGTTVRVTDFLKSIPVRRQTAQKQAVKTLPKVKKLLFDYAFARPTVKFSFKVLKSKSDLRDNWTFAPSKDASNLQMLAGKIVGKDVTAQCKQESISSEEDDYAIEALMVKPDGDPTKSGSSSRFFSIDGRPLTAERGVMKDLHKTYRSYLQSHVTDSSHQAGSQFLLLRLRCPKGAYDINVEPAKNEVMFEDSQKILRLFEDLCIRLYGEKRASDTVHQPKVKERAAATTGFDVLLAKKDYVPEQQRSAITATHNSPGAAINTPPDSSLQATDAKAAVSSLSSEGSPAKVSRNMYGLDDDDGICIADEQHANHSEPSEPEDIENVVDPHVTNPFVLAKMSTRLQPLNLTAPDTEASSRTAGQTGPRSERSAAPAISNTSVLLPRRSSLLPSPSTSPEREQPYQNPGPPDRPWKTRHPRGDEEESLSSSEPVAAPRPTLLDAWTQSVNSSSPVQKPSDLIEVRRSEPMRNSGFPVRTPAQPRTQKSATQTSTRDPKRGQQAPFRTPFKKTTPSMPSSGPQHFPSPEVTPRPSSRRASLSFAGTSKEAGPSLPGFARPRMDTNAELDEIMDFEHRKRDTILQHRGKQKTNRVSASNANKEQAHEQEQQLSAPQPYNEGLVPQERDQDTDYASRFALDAAAADIAHNSPQPNTSALKQNPHENRYKKALRDREERSRVGTATEHVDGGIRVASSPPHPSIRDRPKLSPSDPRAYLIRHQDDQGAPGKLAKQNRTKTTKLPFELIPANAATSHLLAMLDSSVTVEVAYLRRVAESLEPYDPYIRSGPAGHNETSLRSGSLLLSEVEPVVRAMLEGRTSSPALGSAGEADVSTDMDD
ncbi:hypothetical protein PMZ80_007194 [Knufia obscura]|uniref:DNA mismatch repair protein S5 domain-containing protein n=1 Tax=Knufia obscura TaxID=1635080 RepID=A0ABR0RKB2_9EURO|nr:hypothetical protein PMZ80_007194 [Knufia obscura]